ncbi:hypothetical protein [Eubacterium callanderi]|uniref:hypothetical protein n=1 Tax=Eubacterium callanderi TaxID=53442 RepID=UPI001D0616B1|nr:hypothetical protein [Eubacterium callanderi]MCB6661660.1 hypothetical protein [Eubacterium callanderi]MCB6754591.1 hypothetical protein [Eubacterium callanderi]MCB7106219.1 hypothetical protein [Eubacterium callanderi]MCG4821570.1 hypothetical protein [Eubacterium callanderi]MCQ5191937.1 hypothetical protein [Eubacterium callanderi]
MNRQGHIHLDEFEDRVPRLDIEAESMEHMVSMTMYIVNTVGEQFSDRADDLEIYREMIQEVLDELCEKNT